MRLAAPRRAVSLAVASSKPRAACLTAYRANPRWGAGLRGFLGVSRARAAHYPLSLISWVAVCERSLRLAIALGVRCRRAIVSLRVAVVLDDVFVGLYSHP
jgi:hypothetical protein